MYVYIHTHTYIRTHTYIHTHMYTHTRTYTHTYIRTHTHTFTRRHSHTHSLTGSTAGRDKESLGAHTSSSPPRAYPGASVRVPRPPASPQVLLLARLKVKGVVLKGIVVEGCGGGSGKD